MRSDSRRLVPKRRPTVALIIPTLNAAETLPATLAAAAELRAAGVPVEIVVADGGSSDGTTAIAREHGVTIVTARPGRGTQLSAGGAAATAAWLLFLHADTTLTPGWVPEVRQFIETSGQRAHRAAVFRLRLDDPALAARCLDQVVVWRTRLLGLPYGDQGLLIPTELYRSIGGFADIPIMEDVDLARRLGRRRLVLLRSAAVTSAVRYRNDGYLRRTARNVVLLSLYLSGISPARLVRLYG